MNNRYIYINCGADYSYKDLLFSICQFNDKFPAYLHHHQENEFNLHWLNKPCFRVF